MSSTRLPLAVLLFATFGIGQTAQAQSSGSGSLVQDLLNPATSATCLISGHRVFSPGITLTPSRGTFRADTETKLNCYGQIDGSRVAGPVHLELEGTYGDPSLLTPNGDTCLFGRMLGNVNATVQTVDGRTISVSGQVVFTRLGLAVTAEGPLYGPPDFKTRVDIVAIPDPGQTCVTTALTGVTIVGTVRLSAP